MSDARLLSNGTVYVDGDVLHPRSQDCPHDNEHACPTCDFDGYYAAFRYRRHPVGVGSTEEQA